MRIIFLVNFKYVSSHLFLIIFIQHCKHTLDYSGHNSSHCDSKMIWTSLLDRKNREDTMFGWPNTTQWGRVTCHAMHTSTFCCTFSKLSRLVRYDHIQTGILTDTDN